MFSSLHVRQKPTYGSDDFYSLFCIVAQQDKQLSAKWLTSIIIISMLLWGISWPSGKVLTHYCSAVNFSVYRYVLVVVTLLLILVISRGSLVIRRQGIPYVIAAGALLSGYSYLFFMGLKNGSPGAGGVLVTILNPVVAYMIGMVTDKKVPARNEAIGLLLGLLAGSVLLQLWTHAQMLLDSGNIYFLLASVTWAVMSKFTSKAGKFGTSGAFSLWQYVVTLACFLPWVNMVELKQALAIKNSVFWLNLFFSASIVTAVATSLYFYATTKLGAEKASSFIFVVPVAAAVSSWLMLGEQIKPHTMIGGIIGIGAVYMINSRSAKKK